ncbi:MAG: rhodanese-like domain-containing protein [Gammaproteobacteria bacterium]
MAAEKSFRELSVTEISEYPLPDMVIVDVREHEEWDDGHLANSVHVPLGELQDALHSHPVFQDKNRHLVMLCRSGNRSASAAQFLTDCGFENAYNLGGGIIAWAAAGLPIEMD